MQQAKPKDRTDSLRWMIRMMMNENVTKRMRDPLSRQIKDRSGFALLVAMFIIVAVSLVILSFALSI